MYRRSDPRFRRTLNEISQTIESANESAQANIFTFSHNYLSPCFASFGNCLQSCSSVCCSERTRKARPRSGPRPELSFDFYDDWDHDETAGLLSWDEDDVDGSSPSYGAADQPARQRAMSYGARRDKYGRRKSQPHADPDADPNLIPATSYFGLFGRLTSNITGTKVLRYKPSAADLQDNPGSSRSVPPTTEDGIQPRNRSNTAASIGSTGSLSSRGDIFPSEDEDDAVPLDDEFAMVLERRTTGSAMDEASTDGKRRSGKRPSTGSRKSTRTMSSRSTQSSKRLSRAPSASPPKQSMIDVEPKAIPSMTELKQEEERIQREEEDHVARKREAAQRLASKRGLGVSDHVPSPSMEGKPLPSPWNVEEEGEEVMEEHKLPPSSPSPPRAEGHDGATTPFPSSDPPPAAAEDDASGGNDGDFVPAQLPRFSSS